MLTKPIEHKPEVRAAAVLLRPAGIEPSTVAVWPPRSAVSARRMWSSPDMHIALARHDIGTVFRLMQRYGHSQRAIAALTGITQAEVSEIISGRRRMLAYSVLERLADGLEVPRGWLGLAFDDASHLLREGTG